ncbi:pseudaminic acid synthase [Geomonas limicola]|uniref:Pseudaminic acid synthase n=1 Tax=Geomonas limicola TaxID=2740186 RepID=A0A6V8N7F7_9BACT|nr:pseudaminic acid synthase [Geomonas limicola]GFO68502.1 pseudaminic acid synthase [Geomonas limicola]
MSGVTIGGRRIGSAQPPLVIAEMSGNHNQSLERALEIVEAAARSGAHALKLQTYTADTITLDVQEGDFRICNRESLWDGANLHQLYRQASTPYEWHAAIFERCRELGVLCFSTPFDESAVDFLEELGAPAYKIASFENVHLPLIRKAAATGKPLIISTGMASLAELDEAVTTARAAGCRELVLLKCTSSYPATPEFSNLRTIPHLRELFGVEVGLSDHTLGIGAALAAVALGATVIEKHFTLCRADGGIDSAFSLEPAELAALVQETERGWQALGTVSYGPTAKEKASLQFRRSLYLARDMRAGESFTPENLRVVRPGFGLPPKYYELMLGRKITRDAPKGTPLSWDLV